MPPVYEQQDWQTLEHRTGDLLAQGKHGYPKVQRDLSSLLQVSQSAQARTSRLRSQDEHAAATRLLAMQGLNGGRLGQEAKALMVPTVEDVFHADTNSTDDYLGEIQSMTILTAIQECQQETIMSFEHRNEDSMFRDWASDKQGVFSAVAPFSGLADSSRAAGGLSFGTVTPNELIVFAGGTKLGLKEQAYVSAVKGLTQATAAKQLVDPIATFGAACEQYEDKTPNTLMSICWKLLGDIVAKAPRVSPADHPQQYIEALIQGARKHLQAGFLQYMLGQINRNRGAAQRGADPDPLRDVQAYIVVKYKDKGPLDLVAGPGGLDTTWAQIYFSLRAGLPDVALKAAEKASDAVQQRNTGMSVKQLLQFWLDNPAAFREKHGAQLVGDCERLLQSYNSKQPSLKQDFHLLVCALLAGHNTSLDALAKHNPRLIVTMEDYLWSKLVMVNSAAQAAPAAGQGGAGSSMFNGGGGGMQAASAYTLASLQSELNRWDSKYYTSNGKDPLVYLTVLLLTLQFKRALNYLLTDPLAKSHRVDGIHLAIALHMNKVLECPTESLKESDMPDLAGQLAAFGRRYVTTDSITALQYYMLAAAVSGRGLKEQGKLFRELLVQSRDYGTLLGGGGAMGDGGAIRQFVPDPQQRQQLFAAVAYDCQCNQQPDEARELFLAAGKPLFALQIINMQLTAAIHSQQGAMTDAIGTLLTRGNAAVEAIQQNPNTAATAAANAFQDLQIIREVLELAHGQKYGSALQVAQRLKFLPAEQARVDNCRNSVRQLDDSVRERLSDVLLALVECVMQLVRRGEATGQLMQQVACLKLFVLGLDAFLEPTVFERINMCARELGV